MMTKLTNKKTFLLALFLLTSSLSLFAVPTQQIALYVVLHKYDALNNKNGFIIEKPIVDRNGQAHNIAIIIEPQTPTLWSYTFLVDRNLDAQFKKTNVSRSFITLDNNHRTSNMVFLKFANDGKLEFISDSNGFRIAKGEARLLLSYYPITGSSRSGTAENITISLGTINGDQTLLSEQSKSSLRLFKTNS